MTEPRRPRVLVVSSRRAWPPFPGSQLRMDLELEALASIADVEALFLLPDDEPPNVLPPAAASISARTVRVPRRSAAAAIARWATPLAHGAPWGAVKLAYDAAADEVADAVRATTADVIWVIDSHLWPVLRTLPVAGGRPRLVVDLDDLQDEKIAHRQRHRAPLRRASRRDLFFRAVDVVDRRRWRRLQRRLADQADAVLLCSELDRDRFAHDAVRLLPNGYVLDAAVPASASPTALDVREVRPLLFAGNLAYLPNIEALSMLVDEVLPVLRRQVPSAVVHVVGAAGPEVEHLRGRPGVSFLGRVLSMEEHLAGAAACVVPLRSGGGTRIKILEAFAHRLPVVTTTVGAEGLDVTDGVELLIRDDPEAFAEACAELLRDPAGGAQLADAGARYYERTSTPAVVRAAVRAIIDELVPTAAGASAPTGSPAPVGPSALR